MKLHMKGKHPDNKPLRPDLIVKINVQMFSCLPAFFHTDGAPHSAPKSLFPKDSDKN